VKRAETSLQDVHSSITSEAAILHSIEHLPETVVHTDKDVAGNRWPD